jgi:ferredoxin-thioredoxin reductase catalytic chain
MDAKIKSLIEEYKDYAKENGFGLNPNQKMLEGVIRGLLENEKKFGKRYCPCRVEHNDKTVCPCVYHKDEIKEQGHCHCFLFTSKEG